MAKAKRVPVVFSFTFPKSGEKYLLGNREILRNCFDRLMAEEIPKYFIDEIIDSVDLIQQYFTDEIIDGALLEHRELLIADIIKDIVAEGRVNLPYYACHTIAKMLLKQHESGLKVFMEQYIVEKTQQAQLDQYKELTRLAQILGYKITKK